MSHARENRRLKVKRYLCREVHERGIVVRQTERLEETRAFAEFEEVRFVALNQVLSDDSYIVVSVWSLSHVPQTEVLSDEVHQLPHL